MLAQLKLKPEYCNHSQDICCDVEPSVAKDSQLGIAAFRPSELSTLCTMGRHREVHTRAWLEALPEDQIFFSKTESIVFAGHEAEPAMGSSALLLRVGVDQEALGLSLAATHSAPQLVQLGQTKSLCIVDDHHAGFLDIQTHLQAQHDICTLPFAKANGWTSPLTGKSYWRQRSIQSE